MSLPFATFEGEVKPEWIDGNSHMNLAYYLVLFDHALDLLCAEWDLDWAYTKRTQMGMFAVETHTLYEQELVLGDRVRVHSWALAADAKRVHVAQEMFRLPDMARASCWEAMMLHVDLTQRKVVPWPEAQRSRIATTVAAHAALERPGWVGRKVAMPG
jgi:acyl-CoA thioester hydrolase